MLTWIKKLFGVEKDNRRYCHNCLQECVGSHGIQNAIVKYYYGEFKKCARCGQYNAQFECSTIGMILDELNK